MFSKAVPIAVGFTRPVVISSRTTQGACAGTIGAYVVVNREGSILTAGQRCGNLIAHNAFRRGPAWSVCRSCEVALVPDAGQREVEPPLIRRCLVCGGLLGHRRRNVKACTDACRNALSRILERPRPAPAERAERCPPPSLCASSMPPETHDERTALSTLTPPSPRYVKSASTRPTPRPS